MEMPINNTPNDLLDCINAELAELTKDLLLNVPGEKSRDTEPPRAPKIFGMYLDKKGDETKQVPYILTVIQTGHDEQRTGGNPESYCGVRLVFATYNENLGEGRRELLALISRIRIGLSKRKVLGGQYVLRGEIDWAIDPAYTGAYHYGEMLMGYEIPPLFPDSFSDGFADNWENENPHDF